MRFKEIAEDNFSLDLDNKDPVGSKKPMTPNVVSGPVTAAKKIPQGTNIALSLPGGKNIVAKASKVKPMGTDQDVEITLPNGKKINSKASELSTDL